jgi:NAD+ synthase (glutamine-hydrolysing)
MPPSVTSPATRGCIGAAARAAHAAGAAVVVAPELAITGYPPEDLLLRPSFLQACDETLAALAAELADCEGLHLVVGHPHAFGGPGDVRSKSLAVQRRFNAASVLAGGRIVATYCKRELPNYQVFDERRYFASGRDAGFGPVVFEAAGLRFGVLICEDAWFDEPARAARDAGAQVLCVLNASPFHIDKSGEREARMAERACDVGLPLLYAHLVGGQDEVVFDGASFAVDARGVVTARAPSFEEALLRSSWRPTARRAANCTRCPSSRRRPGARSSPGCATTSARTASRARSSACRAASTRRWCWPSRSTRWAPSACAR